MFRCSSLFVMWLFSWSIKSGICRVVCRYLYYLWHSWFRKCRFEYTTLYSRALSVVPCTPEELFMWSRRWRQLLHETKTASGEAAPWAHYTVLVHFSRTMVNLVTCVAITLSFQISSNSLEIDLWQNGPTEPKTSCRFWWGVKLWRPFHNF